jgi:phage-related protein
MAVGTLAATKLLEIVVNGRGDAPGFLGRVGKAFSGLGKTVKRAGTIVAGAVAGIGAGITKLAIDAAPLEGIEQAFEGVASTFEGGSETMLKALQEGSDGMITNRDLMLQFNKSAQLVSNNFAQRLPDAMDMLGKVAGSTGEDLDFLLNSYTTGVARLSPMILDNLGIQVDLTAAYEDYAETLGINSDELSKNQQQVALNNQVLELLRENTAKIPDITDNATTSLAQMRAGTKNFRDELGKRFLPGLKAVLAVMQGDGEGGAKTFILELAEKATAWFAEKLPTAVDLVKSKFDELWPVIVEKAQNAWAIAGNVFQTLREWVSVKVPEGVAILRAKWEQLWPIVVEKAKNAWAIGRKIFQVLREWIQVKIPSGIAFLRAKWNEYWPQIRDTVVGVWNKAKKIFETLREWIQVKIPRFVESLRTKWEETWGKVQSKTEGVRDVLRVAGRVIGTVVGDIWEILAGVVEWVKENLPLMGETATKVRKNLVIAFTFIGNVVKFVMNKIVIPVVDNAWNIVVEIVDTAVDTFLNLLTLGMQIFTGDWEGAWETVETIANDLFESVKTIIGELLEGVSNWFGLTLDEVLEPWRSVVDDIAELINILPEKALDAGRAFLQNMRDGINNGWEDFVGFFKGKLGDVADLLPFSEPKAGAASPLYGLAESGQAIIKNIMGGFDDAAPMLNNALQDIGQPARSGMATAGAGTSGRQIVIYGGIQVYGAQDARGLVEELEALAQ